MQTTHNLALSIILGLTLVGCGGVGSSSTPPVAKSDSVEVQRNANSILNILENDIGDIDDTSIDILDLPDNGETQSSVIHDITYQPFKDFCGLDSFTYSVQDKEGLFSNIATVKIAIVTDFQLEGTAWFLTSIPRVDPNLVVLEKRTLSFLSLGEIGLNDGINTYGGAFTDTNTCDTSIAIGSGTKRGSLDPDVNNVADNIRQRLSSAAHFNTSDNDKTLTFFDKDDQVTLVYSRK